MKKSLGEVTEGRIAPQRTRRVGMDLGLGFRVMVSACMTPNSEPRTRRRIAPQRHRGHEGGMELGLVPVRSPERTGQHWDL
jgi:hypothetical protein